MPLLMLTYDLPQAAASGAYVEKARSVWIPSVLRQPGVLEIRAYRYATNIKPDVMTHVDFDSVQAVELYLSSRQYSTVISGLTATGCSNIAAQVWNPSPIAPDPIRQEGQTDHCGYGEVAGRRRPGVQRAARPRSDRRPCRSAARG